MSHAIANASSRLQQLENVINQGLDAFFKVGVALNEICESRLYKDAGYASFDDYCKERWGFGRDFAYKQIRSAKVVDNILSANNVDNCIHSPKEEKTIVCLPANEGQVRHLTKLEPKEQAEVWVKVVEKSQGKPITEALVKSVVDEFRGVTPRGNEQVTVDAREAVRRLDVMTAKDEEVERLRSEVALLKSELEDADTGRKEDTEIILKLERRVEYYRELTKEAKHDYGVGVTENNRHLFKPEQITNVFGKNCVDMNLAEFLEYALKRLPDLERQLSNVTKERDEWKATRIKVTEQLGECVEISNILKKTLTGFVALTDIDTLFAAMSAGGVTPEEAEKLDLMMERYLASSSK